MATEDKRKNPLDVWFKKGLAVEEHHPEEAIKYYDKIIQHEDKIQKEKLRQKKFFANVLQHKGLTLEKLGRNEEAKKCFDIVKKVEEEKSAEKMIVEEEKSAEKMIESMAKLEKKNKEFAVIWNRIVKNQQKTMQTKKGVVFSYRIWKNSIVPQYLTKYNEFNKDERYGIISNDTGSEKFVIYAHDRAISKKLVRDAAELFPYVDGPTELKRDLDINNLDTRITRLWGILNDKRILE